MISWILDNMDMLNIIAAWVGAVTGVIGLLYSVAMNRATVKISNCFKDRVDPKSDYQYNFELVNTSNVAVVIKSVQLFDINGKEIFDNGFDPSSVVPRYATDEYRLSRIPLPLLSKLSFSQLYFMVLVYTNFVSLSTTFFIFLKNVCENETFIV